MTIQEKCVEKIYEFLPHKKGKIVDINDVLCITKNMEHMPTVFLNPHYRIGLINKQEKTGEDTGIRYEIFSDNILDQSDELCELVYKILSGE